MHVLTSVTLSPSRIWNWLWIFEPPPRTLHLSRFNHKLGHLVGPKGDMWMYIYVLLVQVSDVVAMKALSKSTQVILVYGPPGWSTWKLILVPKAQQSAFGGKNHALLLLQDATAKIGNWSGAKQTKKKTQWKYNHPFFHIKIRKYNHPFSLISLNEKRYFFLYLILE